MVKGEFFLPTIPATINGFVELFTEGLRELALDPVRQLVLGFLIALAIAIPLGGADGPLQDRQATSSRPG